MPHAEHGPAATLDVLDLLRDQMRPAVGDRMARVVPDRVDIVDLEIALEIREHLAVARGGKTVGVGEVEDHCRYSPRSTPRGARRCQESPENGPAGRLPAVCDARFRRPERGAARKTASVPAAERNSGRSRARGLPAWRTIRRAGRIGRT